MVISEIKLTKIMDALKLIYITLLYWYHSVANKIRLNKEP